MKISKDRISVLIPGIVAMVMLALIVMNIVSFMKNPQEDYPT